MWVARCFAVLSGKTIISAYNEKKQLIDGLAMFQIAPATRPTSRAAFFLTLTALLVSACGLGMDTEARMMRVQQAYADGEYRAAIIDAKNVLQQQPGRCWSRLWLSCASARWIST